MTQSQEWKWEHRLLDLLDFSPLSKVSVCQSGEGARLSTKKISTSTSQIPFIISAKLQNDLSPIRDEYVRRAPFTSVNVLQRHNVSAIQSS
eukprot:4312191-Amphidinium_carterae.1